VRARAQAAAEGDAGGVHHQRHQLGPRKRRKRRRRRALWPRRPRRPLQRLRHARLTLGCNFKSSPYESMQCKSTRSQHIQVLSIAHYAYNVFQINAEIPG
jgi:hypothetical protein